MFTDMHHHLVYGVDDGARTLEGMQRLIRDAQANQITRLITTPHVTPGQVPFDFDAYQAHLEEARAYCAQEGFALELYTGAELLYTPDTPRLLREGRAPTLANSRFALIEFSPDDPYAHLLEAAQRVAGAGFVPVFAHVERYACLHKISQLQSLRQQYNVRIQVNARTVLHKHGFFRQRWIDRLFREGAVDYIASDAHDLPERHCRMLQCYEKLADCLGEDTARRLTGGNQQEIFE